jgi:hypothetical protein
MRLSALPWRKLQAQSESAGEPPLQAALACIRAPRWLLPAAPCHLFDGLRTKFPLPPFAERPPESNRKGIWDRVPPFRSPLMAERP